MLQLLQKHFLLQVLLHLLPLPHQEQHLLLH
jgi:hypothetical protein